METRSLKPPRKMQNEFWLCDVLVVWKIVDMTLYHVRTGNKNIYCVDGAPPNFLAVMRCLLNFFAVLRCSEPPKVPLAKNTSINSKPVQKVKMAVQKVKLAVQNGEIEND